MNKFEKIIASDLPEVEKLARSFEWVTHQYVDHAQQEIELLQAIRDEESLIKERIRLGMMNHARSIFQDCYLRVTGRKAWDE